MIFRAGVQFALTSPESSTIAVIASSQWKVLRRAV
jgi:hypothetical protein